MQTSELLDFTGGINTVVAPHLLPLNEAIALTNVDIDFGSLKSITNLESTKSAQNRYFVEYRRKLYYYRDWRSNALIDDKLYWADGQDSGKILPDGTELPLGISTPTTPATYEAAGNAGDGTHKGDFKYTYTFYSSDTGVESAPAPLRGYRFADEQNFIISGLETLPAEANQYRIYRIGGYLARFTLVKTISVGDVPYTDSIDDTFIDGRLLQTLRTGTPPTSINNFTEMNGRLFGSVSNRVYFSGLGAPDSWYTDDFFNMPDTITGIAKSQAGLLVFGRHYTYLLFGASAQSFRLKVLSDYLGCVKNTSIAQYANKAIWLGEDGVYMSDGYSMENLTYRKIKRISSMNVFSSAIANDVYYFNFLPTMVPSEELVPSNDLYPGGVVGAGVDGGSTEGIVAIDFRRGNKYSYHYLAYNEAISLGIHRSELYLVLDGEKETIGCTQKFPCDIPFCFGEQVLGKLGGTLSDSFKTLDYLSPQLIDGSYSTLKEYDKVRVNFIGKFTVAVIFSNLDIAIVEDIETPRTVTNLIELSEETDSVALIGIPNANNKSYSIQFAIRGTGIVKSIQYSWKNRELP